MSQLTNDIFLASMIVLAISQIWQAIVNNGYLSLKIRSYSNEIERLRKAYTDLSDEKSHAIRGLQEQFVLIQKAYVNAGEEIDRLKKKLEATNER